MDGVFPDSCYPSLEVGKQLSRQTSELDKFATPVRCLVVGGMGYGIVCLKGRHTEYG